MSMADSKDLRWIDDFGDELTMAIAMRDWEEAVQQVEKGRCLGLKHFHAYTCAGQSLLEIAQPNVTAKEMLGSRLDHLRSHLSSQMLHDLSSHEIRKTTTVHLVSLLSRIGSADTAKEAFLKARKQVMTKRVREIRCEGDTSIYINELAIVCFTIIRHTGDWYMSAFHEPAMASGELELFLFIQTALMLWKGFVSWAKEQIETFATMFRRQVDVPGVDDESMDECIKVVATNNRKVGLRIFWFKSESTEPRLAASRRRTRFYIPPLFPSLAQFRQTASSLLHRSDSRTTRWDVDGAHLFRLVRT